MDVPERAAGAGGTLVDDVDPLEGDGGTEPLPGGFGFLACIVKGGDGPGDKLLSLVFPRSFRFADGLADRVI